jgi:hypothetical protein
MDISRHEAFIFVQVVTMGARIKNRGRSASHQIIVVVITTTTVITAENIG